MNLYTNYYTTKPPILEVLRGYFPHCRIRKSGTHWKANCLFHSEKTASMVIYPKDNKVFCFGCQKSADSWELLGMATGRSFAELQKERNATPDYKTIQHNKQKIHHNEKFQEQINGCWFRLTEIYRRTFDVERRINGILTNNNADAMADVLFLREIIDKILLNLESGDISKQKQGLSEAQDRGLFSG